MEFGQDVGAMIEARNAQEWEELNAEPEIPVYLIDSELWNAWCECSDANDRLAWACEYAKGHPFEDKVLSLMDEIEKIQDAIKKLQEEVKTL
jgi:hypothetical protein